MLVSPLKVNVGPIAPAVEELLDAVPELEGRRSVHGTATCLPELEELPDIPELVEDELVDDELPAAEPELLNETMAKSTLPDVGLMMTSWIVPSVSPDEPWILELLSLLAWTS